MIWFLDQKASGKFSLKSQLQTVQILTKNVQMLILILSYFITTVIEVRLQKGFGTNCVEQAWAQNKTRELILQKYSNFFAPLARTEGSSAWFDDDRKPQKK